MTDTTYIVTGASYGIGRATAAELASRGHDVVAVARSAAPLATLAAAWPDRITEVAADLATENGIERVTAAVAARDSIAGVVHAAGSLIALEPYDQVDPGRLVEHFRVHVAAPVELYQALAADHTVERMLYIDSYSASVPRAGWPAYSVIKAAAQMAARAAALELGDTRVIRVFPGAVNTRIVESVLASSTETATAFAAMVERGELAEPDATARFIADVLVEASDEVLDGREVWDYNNPDDRALLR